MMDIKIFALVAFVTVLGSFTEARSPFYPYETRGLRDWPVSAHVVSKRSRREIDNSNGESTSQATTTTSSTTDPTSSSTTSSSTTPSSTTPSTESTTTSTTPSSTTPSTEPTTTSTTEATSPTTTPTSTSVTTPTTTSSTTPASSTTPGSTEPTSQKPNVQSRLNNDEPKPEDSTKKPDEPSNDKMSTPLPYFGAPGFGGYPYFDPSFGYPGYNSIPSYGPNYAWTGTNNGPGYASAGASAGSFPGYPGIGYPMILPTAPSPTGLPMGSPTGSPFFGSRGGFPDNSPNQNNSPNKDNSPNQNGYNFGGDPLYNAGPGFYPGQFPNYNDPFDMFKQIQAQIEAQHQANMDLHNRLANEAANYGNYGGGEPQISSASIGLGPYGGFQSGQISPMPVFFSI